MVSPEVEVDFEDLKEDFSGGTVSINYPQQNGTWKKFDYVIPNYIVEESIKRKDTEPIVQYLADFIAKKQFYSLKMAGIGVVTESISKYRLNQEGIIRRGLTGFIIEEIFTKGRQTKLSEYFDVEKLKIEKEKIEDYKFKLHLQLLDFLGEIDWSDVKNIFFTVYHQRKK